MNDKYGINNGEGQSHMLKQGANASDNIVDENYMFKQGANASDNIDKGQNYMFKQGTSARNTTFTEPQQSSGQRRR